MNILTKNTKLIKFNKYSFEDICLELEPSLCYNDWTKINNDWYYYKHFNFNEILGEYLAKHINLKTVHNELGVMNNNIIYKSYYTLTKNFKNNEMIYLTGNKLPINFGYNSITSLTKILKDKENYLQLKKDLLLLSSLDIFMRQNDRKNYNNMIFEKDNQKNINLAPTFDYSDSFSNIGYYHNCFFKINFTKEDFYKLFNLYPEFYDMLISWLSFDINITLNQIEKDYNFNFNNRFIQNYNEECEKSQKIIKKVI